MITNKNILFWTVTILVFTFFCLMTFGIFVEWWTFKIKKDIGNYLWGPLNENPWYYDNPNLYSTVMLTEGLLFTIALSILARQIFNKDKTKILYSLMTCIGLFVLIYIKDSIGYLSYGWRLRLVWLTATFRMADGYVLYGLTSCAALKKLSWRQCRIHARLPGSLKK